MHTLFYFLVALGVLVTFHEFGHYWAARRLGVKVLRFSVGFGQVLWRRQKTPDATEFTIAAIPLGGYVKMVDEREGPVEAQDLPYAFNRQSLGVRSAIVVAGPLSNLALAVALFWAVLVIGETGLRAVLGPVAPASLAEQAGFQEGDEILAIDQHATPTWNLAIGAIFEAVMEQDRIRVRVMTREGDAAERVLLIPSEIAEHPEQLNTRLGFRPWEPSLPAVIDHVLPDSAAERAGMRGGDRVVSADGVAIRDWRHWVEYVRQRPEQSIAAVIERDEVAVTLRITPQLDATAGGIGKIGAAVRVPPDLQSQLRTEYRLGPVAAIGEAVVRTADYAWLTAKMVTRMFVGQASVENLSGPISIAQYAGQSARMGLVHFLKFLAVVSISLGVLNLLPIPVLDGGHLAMFLAEAIKGSPISEQTQALTQRIGLAILIFLMGLAFTLDLQKLFP